MGKSDGPRESQMELWFIFFLVLHHSYRAGRRWLGESDKMGFSKLLHSSADDYNIKSFSALAKPDVIG